MGRIGRCTCFGVKMEDINIQVLFEVAIWSIAGRDLFVYNETRKMADPCVSFVIYKPLHNRQNMIMQGDASVNVYHKIVFESCSPKVSLNVARLHASWI